MNILKYFFSFLLIFKRCNEWDFYGVLFVGWLFCHQCFCCHSHSCSSAVGTLVDRLWLHTRCSPSHSISLFSVGLGRQNKMENNPLVEIRQFTKAKAKCCLHTNKGFILVFPSSGDVPTLPRKQSFNTCSSCSGRQTLEIMNAPASSFFC